MILGVLKEPSFESRVSLVAETSMALVKKGVSVWVETNAGSGAACTDEEYTKAGALIKSREEILQSAEVILSIHPPSKSEITRSRKSVDWHIPAFISSRTDGRMGRRPGYRFQHGYAAPDYPCTKYGCAEFAGKYFRL